MDSALADISQESVELSPPRRLTRVAVATMVGSAIEAFDFLSYGTATALVFNKLFFPTFDPTVGTLAVFGAFAAGYFVRPIGGIIFGHFGDRLGRKAMLTVSLIVMGTATVLIGCLPTYAEIGIWAAVLLTLLRVAQGLSFGGELAGRQGWCAPRLYVQRSRAGGRGRSIVHGDRKRIGTGLLRRCYLWLGA